MKTTMLFATLVMYPVHYKYYLFVDIFLFVLINRLFAIFL